MTLSPSLLIILITSLLASISISADTLYVLKNIKVHTEASLESPVTKLLLGGEKIEVLGIDGDFTEIEDNDNKIGWVASDYLTDIEPAKVIPKKEIKKTIVQAQKKSTPKVSRKEEKDRSNSNKVSSDINHKKLTLQKENQQLQVQLEKIRHILKDSTNTTNSNYESDIEEVLTQSFTSPNLSLWTGLAGLVIGFIMGLLWSDYRQRRQHGGFKV
jgi:uncharacterized protein YgiM (DUF1202 family)